MSNQTEPSQKNTCPCKVCAARRRIAQSVEGLGDFDTETGFQKFRELAVQNIMAGGITPHRVIEIMEHFNNEGEPNAGMLAELLGTFTLPAKPIHYND